MRSEPPAVQEPSRAPMKQRRPDPPPVPTNDLRVVVLGTVLWAVALVLTAAFRREWAGTCLAGFLLGLLGIAYTRRRR